LLLQELFSYVPQRLFSFHNVHGRPLNRRLSVVRAVAVVKIFPFPPNHLLAVNAGLDGFFIAADYKVLSPVGVWLALVNSQAFLFQRLPDLLHMQKPRPL
jgi:hypothetical protein